jgi:YVTN family beta-propeller protein
MKRDVQSFRKSILVCFIMLVAVSFAYAQEPVLTKIGSYKCGRQPKQVLFSPDSKYIIMPLLDDNGFDIFSVQEKKIIKRINPPNATKVGFAEGLFIPQKNTFLVSQMTTANVYEYTYPAFEFKRTIPTTGNWSKFIAFSSEKQLLAVSNWVSNDVSIIDYKTGNCIKKISTGAAPRGLYFMEGGKTIISLSFDDGLIEKYDVESGKQLAVIKVASGAMRHIVLNNDNTKAYVSDMYHRLVYEVNLGTFKITGQTQVFNNPNTIKLYKNRWLFVSSRGPNNKEDYTKRSPQNGKIQIIDTSSMKVIQAFEGGNQPTGLDISPDGRYLCFSNFQDENIELYEIK